MKVVAFCGSGRKESNTTLLLESVLQPLSDTGADTELIELAGNEIRGCMANNCIARMAAADAIILGSPAYFSDITSEMKALIDRSGMVSQANGDLYRRKLGAAVVAVGRAGAIHAFDTINHFFLANQMIVVGSNSWNTGIGPEKGEVVDDEEGMKTMRHLGENMSWLLKKMKT